MPFAGFRDWDDCVKKQLANGYTLEQAQKICGFIKKKTENVELWEMYAGGILK